MNMSSLHMDAVPFERESCVFCVDFYCMRCQPQNFNEAIFCVSFHLSTGLSTRHIFSNCISLLRRKLQLTMTPEIPSALALF